MYIFYFRKKKRDWFTLFVLSASVLTLGSELSCPTVRVLGSDDVHSHHEQRIDRQQRQHNRPEDADPWPRRPPLCLLRQRRWHFNRCGRGTGSDRGSSDFSSGQWVVVDRSFVSRRKQQSNPSVFKGGSACMVIIALALRWRSHCNVLLRRK